jgi:hypothetical protein
MNTYINIQNLMNKYKYLNLLIDRIQTWKKLIQLLFNLQVDKMILELFCFREIN